MEESSQTWVFERVKSLGKNEGNEYNTVLNLHRFHLNLFSSLKITP